MAIKDCLNLYNLNIFKSNEGSIICKTHEICECIFYFIVILILVFNN